MIQLVSPLLRAVPLAAAAAFAFAGLFNAAAYAGTEPQSRSARSFEEALAAAKARARALREAAAKRPGPLDTTPPVLNKFDTTGSVNVQLPNQSVDVDLDITDDLSGVAYYIFDFYSPTGIQRVWREKTVATPLLHVSPALTFGSYPFSDPTFTVYSEAGDWVVEDFYMYDAAGNEVSYSGSQLRQLGNSEFTLANQVRGDIRSPSLKGGTIDTPTVSRSTPPKGTPAGTLPYVSAQLDLTDKGNGIVSGVYEAIFVLCHPTVASCDDTLRMDGTTNHAGLTHATVTTGGRVRADQSLGQYVIKEVDVYDVAGNWYPYWDVDFNTLFPGGTTITVNP